VGEAPKYRQVGEAAIGPRRPRHYGTDGLLTAAEIARAEHVDPRTIRRWRAQGLRAEPGHRPPRYRLAKVRAWRAQHEPEQIRLRRSHTELLDARARTSARRLAELQGQYVPQAEIDETWQSMTEHVRRCAAPLVAALPPRVIAASPRTPGTVERIVRDAVYEVLTALSKWRPSGKPPLWSRPAAVRKSATVAAARSQLNEQTTALAAARERVAEGDVRLMADVEGDWSRRRDALRTALLAMPTRLAPTLAIALNQAAARAQLSRAVSEALENLNGTHRAEKEAVDA
jgi:hypothetical protein